MSLNVDVMVFDSGVGGLSILESCRREAPHLSYCFVGDSAGLPYGDKSDGWLIERVPRVIAQALQAISCQILIVACNTASTIVLPPLRSQFNFPVIGVVPAIKPAALKSKSKIIGLLATPATVRRPYTEALIQEFAADCAVIKLGSSRLVGIAEEKMRGTRPDQSELKTILAPFAASKPDVVVLGCTHFPLLREDLARAMPGIEWMDSGHAIASRVLHFALAPIETGDKGHAFFTAHDLKADSLSAFGLDQVHFLSGLSLADKSH